MGESEKDYHTRALKFWAKFSLFSASKTLTGPTEKPSESSLRSTQRKLDSSDSDFLPDDFSTTVSFLRKKNQFSPDFKIILAAEHTSFSRFFSRRDISESVRESTTLR